MKGYFRALAVDYDGTLTAGDRPAESVLQALAKVRSSGCRVILVTGRILGELAGNFPEVARHFDALVCENGAVLLHDGRLRRLAHRVAPSLEEALRSRGVPLRRGEVLLATSADHDQVVRQVAVQLRLDDQLVRNRGELMILPAGVSKATGLHEALAELGVSYHSAVGIGDAENDIALLEACEIGVAVANAVPSLKAQADVVLQQEGSAALAAFLEGPFLEGLPTVAPARREIEIGIADDGSPVTVPGSRVQLFIDGPSGAGKSYLAGLLAESLTLAGYSVCVLDLEGDHSSLGSLRGVLSLGGREPLPTLTEVGRFLRHRFSSLVLDVSLRTPALKHAFARDVVDRLTEVRSECGLPHWILIEEAHAVPSEALRRARSRGSLCLVTYHPDWLPSSVLQATDVLITVETNGRARLRRGATLEHSVWFQPTARQIPHVRHQRKYADSTVPYEQGFTFLDDTGWVGPHTCGLNSFRGEAARVPRSSLTHHAARHDFSRWIRDVFKDQELSAGIAAAEDAYTPQDSERFRQQLHDLIAVHYELEPGEQDA